MRIIGIDPGLSGAIAILEDNFVDGFVSDLLKIDEKNSKVVMKKINRLTNTELKDNIYTLLKKTRVFARCK